MYNQFHFSKFIENLISNLGIKDNNVLFIKQYNDNYSFEYEIGKNFGFIDNTEILYFQYDNSELQEAYEPFLGWIKNLYDIYFSDKLSTNEFIELCHVYGAHKQIFTSYLDTGFSTRDIDILINEVSYETHRIKRDIIDIFDYISQKVNLVFVLNRFHYANHSSLDLVYDFINNCTFNKMALLCIYDDLSKKNNNIDEIWKKLSITIEDNNYLMAWDDRSISDSVSVMKKEFTPKASNVESYIIKLNNMMNFLACKQASLYVDMIFQKVNMEHMNLTESQEYQLKVIYVWIKIYTGEVNSAIHMCSLMNDDFDLKNDYEKYFQYNYMTALAYVYSSKSKEASKYADVCMDIAIRNKDEKLILRANVAKCYVEFYGWKFILGDMDTDFDTCILEKFEKNGLYALAGTVYAYAYKRDPEYSVEMSKIKLIAPKFIEKAITIAKEIDDEILLSVAYMNKANLCASVNNYDYVDSIYKECIRIYRKYNETVLMAQIYISVGYNLLMVEQHVHSNEYFNDALAILFEQKDIERIGETLYNMGINCMLALDFRNALEYLITSNKICQILELNGYAVCKLSKLYGLIAICSFYLKNDCNLFYYVNKAEKIIMHLLNDKNADTTYWEEDLFLYYFGKSLLYIREKNYDEAINNIMISKKYAKECVYFTFFSFPFLSVEAANVFRKTNDYAMAEHVLDEAIAVMEKYNLTVKKNLLLSIKNGNMVSCEDRLILSKISIKQIIDTAYYKKELNQFNNENKDIDFLFSWQNILNLYDKSTQDLFEKNLITIKNSFSLDGIYCFLVHEGEVNCVYENADIYFENDKYDIIARTVKNKVSAFIANRTEGILKEQKEIIDCFGHSNLVTILGVPYSGDNGNDFYLLGYANIHSNFSNNKMLLNSKVLQVIKIVFGQFIDAVERIESDEEIRIANNKLQDMATKDGLTGLYNRQGYVRKIKEMFEAGFKTSTIMYFDLDNFKYYNDTYGHDMGDMILIEFANILTSMIKKKDFSVRYGGDEFLLILTDKDVEYSKKIASKIYQELDSKMVKNIENKLGSKLDINKDRKLTCSIGIASIEGNSESDSVADAMRMADKALYEVKKSGKGHFIVGN